jgi:hypothetical protein
VETLLATSASTITTTLPLSNHHLPPHHDPLHLNPRPPDTLFVGLIGRSLGLLRLFGLLIYAIRSAFAGTPRARARAWQLQTCAFGGRIPDQTIIMLLGIVFSCIQ